MSATRTALGLAALLLAAPAPARAQTLGPVVLAAGGGASWQRTNDFTAVGPHLWLGAETVLERRLRVRLDVSVHRFAYAAPSPPPCPPQRFCAPPVTSALELIAVTGVIVWRDTTGANPWYALAGLGAYSDMSGRDANSRVGVNAGIGRSFGATRSWFIETRVNVPYDPYGYGAFIPLTAGWRFFRFTP